MPQPLRIDRRDGVTRLTLDRPDRANALSADLVEALIAAFEDAARDGTRLVVLQGEGKRFCSGFDFSDLQTASEADLVLRFVRVETLLQMIFYAPHPTLALAHGGNFGAGADLVASCSLRVASADATFQMPGLRFGVVLGTRRLAARIGVDGARAVLSETRTFSAEEAHAMGFLSEVRAREAWEEAIDGALRAASALPPDTARTLCRLTAPDTRDGDMAELARAVSTPGLKARIETYRAGMRRAS